MPYFISHPFRKMAVGAASALVLLTAHAGAHDTGKSDSQSDKFGDFNFALNFDDSRFGDSGSHDWDNQSFNFNLGSTGHGSRGGEDILKLKIELLELEIRDAEKSRKSWDDGGSKFVFDRHHGDGHDFGYPWSGHDGGHDGGGDSTSGNGCGNPDPTGGNGCGNGDPNGGNSATPEPGTGYLSLLASGAMALLLVGRNLRRRS